MAIDEGILGRDEDGHVFLNVEGWINEHFTDPTERKLLTLKSQRVSQELTAKDMQISRWKVRKMLKELESTCCRKLMLPPPGESLIEKRDFRPQPEVTIHDVAARIENRRKSS